MTLGVSTPTRTPPKPPSLLPFTRIIHGFDLNNKRETKGTRKFKRSWALYDILEGSGINIKTDDFEFF